MSIILASFLLVFGSLFPIVNPPGSAFIFLAHTRSATHAQRAELAARVAAYAFIIVVGSMFVGSHVLGLFGVSIPALRVGGGLVVAVAGWRLLNAKPGATEGDIVLAATPETLRSAAFYPLTMPLTTGPGTIAVTIALGTSQPFAQTGPSLATVGALLAAMAISAVIYLCFRFADRMEGLLGRAVTDALMRLFALLLLSVGVEIIWRGISEMARTL
ncbi:MAG TPA: MarC family protein [Magnetospirillum sp.]|jgi:multiple antibiotic resistance protein|nr:MarC family protein [Magnetospirillum sp.]